MFEELPPGFPKLEAYTKTAGAGIPPPADFRSLGERVYDKCIHISPLDYSNLRSSVKRRIPYAMWLDSKRDIHSAPDIVSRYYEEIKNLNLEETSRTKRILAPILHTYVTKFNYGLPDFVTLSANLRTVARNCSEKSVSLLKLSKLHEEYDFFDPEKVGKSVSQDYMLSVRGKVDIERYYNSLGLWSGFKDTALGMHIYAAALRLPAKTYADIINIDTILGWTEQVDGSLSAELRAQLANALLLPWVDKDPDAGSKRKISDVCVAKLGDPRFEGFAWAKVDPNAKAVLLRWLTGRTLDIFFDVLRHTADTIWSFRQEFWAVYYKNGYISEAWAVLGPDAHRYVNRNYRGADLSYAHLYGKYDEGQSVLMMRMGDLLFCEWSHNGKLRVAEISRRGIPKLYARSYDASELQFKSLPFRSNTGVVHDEGLPHLHSETRWWQSTASQFIRNKLGI